MSVRVHRSTLVQDVADQLRRKIMCGQVAPGEYLPSRKELAAHYGVGVSTVNEALQALTAVGLITSHPGKGTWVRDNALDMFVHPAAIEGRLGELDTRQVYEARSVIEVALTEMAARRATDDDVERIWHALGSMETAGTDAADFVLADLRFHLAVARAGRNVLLEQLYHVSRKVLATMISDLVRRPGVREESIRIQRVIAQAIEQRDPHRARHATLKHMAYIGGLLEAS